MEDKLNELLKVIGKNITYFENKSMFGVIEYLEEALDNVKLAIQECEEYLNEQGD
ncbi:MAG: hypothetical protein RBR68_07325 [Tenuifilaceae bacterium]|nr:hypothetical protein [Tenuifilaceae bacterium]